ncbi:MAG: alpha/beta hydrolase [Thermomicrobiales bacterium]|nr:alpha/beta hydrolase [Thermomicrobiales bacterium]
MPHPSPPPVVLVHGAWHGGWCWERVAHSLRAAGHPVFTPTLTGLAERHQLLNRDTGLETHITDIVTLLTAQDLEQVVLVGHSYGGMVITGASAAVPERIATLVYLDAFVPGVGDSVMTLMPPDRAAIYAAAAADRGDGWRIPPPTAAAMGVTAPGDAAWLDAHLTDQPLLAFTQPLPRPAPPPGQIPRRYIRCTEGSPSFAAVAARLRADPAWAYDEVPTGHDAMVTEPDALAALLQAT